MTRDPNYIIGGLGLAILASGCLWRLFVWAARPSTSPDPWDQEIEKSLHEPEAVEVCHRCIEPVSPNSWFCGHCGCAVGPYNNLMPYIHVFSEGEVLRNGVNDRLPPSPLIVAGYLLVSLNLYLFFAPIYWIFLFRNLSRPKESTVPV